MQEERPFQFTLKHLLAATGFVAWTLGVGQLTESPAMAVHLSMVFLGWGMWRFAHGRLGGIIPSLLGVDILVCGGISWAYLGHSDFLGFRTMFVIFGSLLILVGLGVFFWKASLECPYWRSQVGLGVFILVVLLGWWMAIPAIGEATIARRKARDTTANRAAMVKAVAQVETVRRQLGRVPDGTELKSLLAEPLPCIRWDEITSPMHYHRYDNGTYELTFCHGDIFIYNSSRPEKGWYRTPF